MKIKRIQVKNIGPYVLNHTANGNTEILANTYFGGKHND